MGAQNTTARAQRVELGVESNKANNLLDDTIKQRWRLENNILASFSGSKSTISAFVRDSSLPTIGGVRIAELYAVKAENVKLKAALAALKAKSKLDEDRCQKLEMDWKEASENYVASTTKNIASLEEVLASYHVKLAEFRNTESQLESRIKRLQKNISSGNVYIKELTRFNWELAGDVEFKGEKLKQERELVKHLKKSMVDLKKKHRTELSELKFKHEIELKEARLKLQEILENM